MTCRMFARQRRAATQYWPNSHTLSEGDSIAGTAPGDPSETDDNGDPAGGIPAAEVSRSRSSSLTIWGKLGGSRLSLRHPGLAHTFVNALALSQDRLGLLLSAPSGSARQ